MKKNIQSLLIGVINGLIVLSIIVIIIFYKPVTIDEPIQVDNALKGFTVTAYCPGYCCNKHWAGYVVDGNTMNYYINKGENIIAADISIFPLGTIIIWNDTEYVVRDVGRMIKGKRLDVLLKTHDDTIKFGKMYNQTIWVKSK